MTLNSNRSVRGWWRATTLGNRTANHLYAHPITGIGLLLLLMFFCSQKAEAQICDSAKIDYIIRDTKGHVIDASTLKPSSFVKDSGDYYERTVERIFFSKTNDEKDATPAMGLRYRGSGACKLKLDEVTLSVGGKTMRLIFNLSLDSYDDSAHSHRVIDSLPFTEGTFRLEPTLERNIPASAWKQVKTTNP
jgi:hypothetical protein